MSNGYQSTTHLSLEGLASANPAPGLPAPTAVVAESPVVVISTSTEQGYVEASLVREDILDATFQLALGGAPEHGTLTLAKSGWYIYEPVDGYEGSDSFSVTATTIDGQTTVITVSITVAEDMALIEGSTQGDVLIGGSGDNTIYGHGSNTYSGDQIIGGAGNDTLIGGAGFQFLDGGEGDDFLDLREGGGDLREELDDTLIGGEGGPQYFKGGNGNDFLDLKDGGGWASGGSGNDTLIGGAKGDTLDAGFGVDQVTGGGGNDYVLLWDADAGDFADSGAGDDQLYLEASTANEALALLDGEVFLGGVLIAAGFEFFRIAGGSADDVLIGGGSLDGKGGRDTLTGGSGYDYLSGGDGGDELDVSSGGGSASGQAGNDTLYGGGGADSLQGGEGKDEFNGGKGEDTLTGGAGNDAFLFASRRHAGDIISDFHNRSGNNDRVLIDASGFKSGLEKGGHLSREQFQVGDNHHAEDKDVRFLFDTRNESLWFDKNGTKDGGLTLVADLQDGAEVTHQDIWLI